MSTQKLVDPANIEKELVTLWEGLAKEKLRACLFNLIVFNELGNRTDYIREIVQKVSEKYPCRVLFITHDPSSKNNYLKTAISVTGSGNIACDTIDIGVAGSEMAKVPSLILPHFVPDLPIALLWTDDPAKAHDLFVPLAKLSERIIFDSEAADSLFDFAKNVLNLQKQRFDTADLNWARTEGFRELLGSIFKTEEETKDIKSVNFCYNEQETESFCHLKVQSLYLIAWLASRLGWKFQSAKSNLEFSFENTSATIQSAKMKTIGPGTIVSFRIEMHSGKIIEAERNPDSPHHVMVKTTTKERCEMPFQFILSKVQTGQSLNREIIVKGTSKHYIEMLQAITQWDKEKLC